jgi:holo-[acyl-carrier protein] synthase
MAIYGVGIDLIRVERIEKSLTRFGDRFERRIFTPAESDACTARVHRTFCLATRFAAKEAFAKALGTGLRPPIMWLDIEVINDHLGRPEISLSSRADSYCRQLGVRSWHLSMTDDGLYGAAVVILEC